MQEHVYAVSKTILLMHAIVRAVRTCAHRLTQGHSALWLGNGTALALGLAQNIVLARAAGAHEYGIYVAAAIYAGFLARMADMGFPSAGAYFLRTTPSRAPNFLLLGIAQCIVFTPVLFGAWYLLSLVPLATKEMGGIWNTHLLLFTALSVVMLANGLISPMLVPLGRMRAYALAICLPPFTALCMALFLAATTRITALTLVTIVVLAQLSGVVVSAVLAAVQFRLPPVSDFFKGIGPIYGYGLQAYPGFTLKTFSQRIDRIVLINLLPPTALAAYAIATSIRDQLSTPITIHSLLVRNKMIDLLQTRNDPRMAKRYLRSELRLWVSFVVPGSIVVAIIAPWLVSLLYGTSFSAAGSATSILILSLGAIAVTTFSWCITLGSNAPGIFSVLTIASTLATVAATAGGALLYGVTGAAVGSLVVTVLSAALWFAVAELHLRRSIAESTQ